MVQTAVLTKVWGGGHPSPRMEHGVWRIEEEDGDCKPPQLVLVAPSLFPSPFIQSVPAVAVAGSAAPTKSPSLCQPDIPSLNPSSSPRHYTSSSNTICVAGLNLKRVRKKKKQKLVEAFMLFVW